MKILYDLIAAQSNISGKSHGGGKYAIIVFYELLKRRVSFECIWDSSKYLREDILEECKNKDIVLYDVRFNDLENIIINGHYDIFYSALPFYCPQIKKTKTKYIGTLHGLRGMEMPKDPFFFLYRLSLKEKIKIYLSNYCTTWWKKWERKKYTFIMNQPNFSYIAVSQHTKYSILSYFPNIKENLIRVYYSPPTSVEYEIGPYAIEKYFLLVSANRPEKNVLRALMALDELFTERKEFMDLKVYITGATEFSFRHNLKNKTKFHFLGYVDERTLDSLYKGAYCFIYPSLNEGFGYPPLEAMHYGVPVIASSFASINEICGEAVLYFNPLDYKELKARILQMFLDESIRKILLAKARKRYLEITSRQKEDLERLVDFILRGHL